MTNINKNLALQELQKLLVLNFSKSLDYMPKDFNTQQQQMLQMFKNRIFLEEVIN